MTPMWDSFPAGLQGWELVCAVPDGGGVYRLIFKRPRGPLTDAERSELEDYYELEDY